MAGIDYGVLVRVDGKHVPELSSGAGSCFHFGDGEFHRYSYVSELDEYGFAKEENIIHFPSEIDHAKKKVLYWELVGLGDKLNIKVKTKPVEKNNVQMYLSTFNFDGHFFEVLQGYDVDSKNFWEKKSQEICVAFISGKRIK